MIFGHEIDLVGLRLDLPALISLLDHHGHGPEPGFPFSNIRDHGSCSGIGRAVGGCYVELAIVRQKVRAMTR
jgi:hypothetical protein